MYMSAKCCLIDSSSSSSSSESSESGTVSNDCATSTCDDGVMPRRYRFDWLWPAEIHPAQLYPNPLEAPYTYGSVCTSKYIVGGWTMINTAGCHWESAERYGLQDASFGPGPSSPPGFICLEGPGPLAYMTIGNPYGSSMRRVSVFLLCQSGQFQVSPPVQPILHIEYRLDIPQEPGQRLDCLAGFELPLWSPPFSVTRFVRAGIYHSNAYSPDPPNNAIGSPFPYPAIPESITVVAA